MRPKTEVVPVPVFHAHCRRCGVSLTTNPESPMVGRTCRALANPDDPPYTYVCLPCDEKPKEADEGTSGQDRKQLAKATGKPL